VRGYRRVRVNGLRERAIVGRLTSTLTAAKGYDAAGIAAFDDTWILAAICAHLSARGPRGGLGHQISIYPEIFGAIAELQVGTLAEFRLSDPEQRVGVILVCDDFHWLCLLSVQLLPDASYVHQRRQNSKTQMRCQVNNREKVDAVPCFSLFSRKILLTQVPGSATV
jgi:hypothetical protein